MAAFHFAFDLAHFGFTQQDFPDLLIAPFVTERPLCHPERSEGSRHGRDQWSLMRGVECRRRWKADWG